MGATCTNTGGSIRVPAAFFALVCAKLTYDRVSVHGVISCGRSLDYVGPLTHPSGASAMTWGAMSESEVRGLVTSSPELNDCARPIGRIIGEKCLGVLPWYVASHPPEIVFVEAIERVL